MKPLKLTAASAALLLLLSGCTPSAPADPAASESASADSAQPEMTAGSKISSQPCTDPSGMTLYSSLSFFSDENEWLLQTFVPEGSLDGQTLLLDDSCHFYIRAVSGENAYIFLDEQIQLGVPEADVWTDPEDNLHIAIRDVRTARYQITDYVYVPAENSFYGTDLIAQDGINFWGTLR